MPDWEQPFKEIALGKGRQIREGTRVAIVSIGHPGNAALRAAEILDSENISTAVFDMRFLKPIDEELLHSIFKQYKFIITLEDASIIGGLGSAVLEFKNDHGYDAYVKRLGIPDRFVEPGSPEDLYKECGFDTEGIVNACRLIVQ